MDRRNFICLPALGGMAPAVAAAAPAGEPAGGSLAGHITMTALAGDCMRVAICSSAIGAGLKAILAGNLDVVRIGGLVQLTTGDVPGLLGGTEKQPPERETALALGFLIDRASSRLTPRLRAEEECDIYRDVAILREISESAGNQAGVTPAQLYDLFATMETRRLIGIHTFSGDKGDMDGWLAGLIEWRRKSHLLLQRYAAVYCAPDPALMRRYVIGPRFYDPKDGLIRIARNVQNGRLTGRQAMAAALPAAATQSQYARALGKGHDYLRAASAYMQGSIDRNELARQIGT